MTDPLRVVVVGNYLADDQPSMILYAESLVKGLQQRGHSVEYLIPPTFFLRSSFSKAGWKKWLGYLDKFLLFPVILRVRLLRLRGPKRSSVLHIADHSNAMYAWLAGATPVVVTCHDVGAIKGALGGLPDCPATFMGRILQRAICSGLRRATAITCVSHYTAQELQDLVLHRQDEKVRVIANGLNRNFQTLDRPGAEKVLSTLPGWTENRRFILSVGSGLRRKNRAVILQVFASVWQELDAWLVIAGESLNAEMQGLVVRLGIGHRLIPLVRPGDQLLEALYRCAYALLFPSRFEGFGWPILEAQSCGCPVLAANNSAQPEVVGQGGWIRDSEDVAGYASDLLRLEEPMEREQLISLGYANAQRFDLTNALNSMEDLYRQL